MDSPKTKIVCTIGPASESRDVIEKMIEAGMNVARLNFSHGDLAGHKKVIENVRAASGSLGRRVAIMGDLSGPKMRIGTISPEPVVLKPGDPFVLTTKKIVGDRHRVSVSFGGLPGRVKPGDTLFLNDGYIQIQVVRVEDNDVICTVRVGGELGSRKGLNLPGIDLGIGAFTPRDYEYLKFAFENGMDAVSQSFVERAADIEAVRKAAGDLGYHPFIIAKIERSGALDHFSEILEAADGIMIARGDLGVEVPLEQIAVIQKRLAREANMRAKPVITATQMLESMTDNRRPTRAEATDVANAILDGTDCVMLSGESAAGKYPVEAVRMLRSIAMATEDHRPMISAATMFADFDRNRRLRPEHIITFGVEECIRRVVPAAIFTPTRQGTAARSIARFRLPLWTIAVTSREATCQHLQFSSGVYPIYETALPEKWNEYVKKHVTHLRLQGDFVFVIAGPSPRDPGANHRMEIVELGR